MNMALGLYTCTTRANRESNLQNCSSRNTT